MISVDRIPTIIPKTKGKTCVAISAGTWHSLLALSFPPLPNDCGLLYSFGSGYHGQLGRGPDMMVSLTPGLVEYLSERHVFCREISAGSHHSAAVTLEGELFTWGSNRSGCLGRTIDEMDVEYSTLPGHVGGFGALEDGIGRGLVNHVSCGKEFTIVSTYPYEGPDLHTAYMIMEEEAARRRDNDDMESLADSISVVSTIQ